MKSLLSVIFSLLLVFALSGSGLAQPTFVGVEGCEGCHSGPPGGDQFNFWSETGHSVAYDSISAFVQQTARCLECHTTGWDTTMANAGADDFVDIEGAYEDNFNVSINDSTEFFKKQNVQCESCHGPASGHVANIFGTGEVPPRDAAAAANCGECHEGEHHPNFSNWLESGHAQSIANPNLGFLLRGADCAGCHTLQGFIQFVGTTPADSANMIPVDIDAPGDDAYPVNCATCHDPHDVKNPGQLRLPPVELCVKCHNPEEAEPPDNPHHSTSSMFAGMGAYEFDGIEYDRESVHQILSPITEEKCVACHVFMTPFDDSDPNNVIPANTGHTFEPRLEGCMQAGCHTNGLSGTTEENPFDHRGRQTMTQTLIDSLAEKLAEIEETVLPTATPEDSFKYEIGLFNLRFAENEGSHGVHNADYSEQVLTTTLAFLDTALVTSIRPNPDQGAGLPRSFALQQNFPNPFNPTTKIRFDVPQRAHVQLVVYNALGQVVRTLVDEELSPQSYEFELDASDLSSGLYFYTFRSDNFVQTKKMLLLK